MVQLGKLNIAVHYWLNQMRHDSKLTQGPRILQGLREDPRLRQYFKGWISEPLT